MIEAGNTARLARGAVVGGVMAAVLAACGGGGGDDAGTPTAGTSGTEAPANGGSNSGAVPETPVARAWGASRTLPAGVAVLQPPSVDPDGALVMLTRSMPAGTVDRGVFDAGGAWRSTHTLAGAAPGNAPSGLAWRGDVFVATATDLAEGSTTLATVRAVTTGAGQATGATALSPTRAMIGGGRAHVDAAGGVTVLWSDSSSGTSETVYHRRRPANGAWSAPVAIAGGDYVVTDQLHPATDGSAWFVHGVASRTVGVTGQVWARRFDSQGVAAAAQRLDDPTLGVSNSYMVRSGVTSAGAMVAWTLDQTAGECLATRAWQAGAWSPMACANAPALAQGVNSFGLSEHVAGRPAVWWTTSTSALRTAFVGADGAWTVDPPVFTGTVYGAALASCPSGSSAMIWYLSDGSVHGARRSANGAWSARVELARVAGKSPTGLQVRADDACRFTFGWALGTGGIYDIVTRGWNAADAAPEAQVVHATGARVPSFGVAGLAVQPSGRAVVVWQDNRDALTHWRTFE